MARGLEARAEIRRAPVLPDDGAVHGTAAGAVPQQGGLALIGDADGDDVARGRAGLLHGAAATFDRLRPDLPARARPRRWRESAAGIPVAQKPRPKCSSGNRLARVDVVPWSMLKTYDVTRASRRPPQHGLHNTTISRHRDPAKAIPAFRYRRRSSIAFISDVQACQSRSRLEEPSSLRHASSWPSTKCMRSSWSECA